MRIWSTVTARGELRRRLGGARHGRQLERRDGALGVAVDEADRVGGAGAATELVFGVVAPFFLVGLAAVNVGIAAAAARAATEHARDRRYPDGSSLAEVQFVQHLIADMDLATRAGALARAGGGASRRGG